ncbi:MAG: hypothetical protein LBR97_00405 [Dysgonamonadaceae bacterium]|nr:hypothetical protein [Dysgonamonadaceae bacterium]
MRHTCWLIKNTAKKPKYTFDDSDNLLIAEGLARDGLDNKDIAVYFGCDENYFSTLVTSIPELSKALKRGRKPLEIVVENSLYKRATGLKVKTQVCRFIEHKCDCAGDKDCPCCDGSGKSFNASTFIERLSFEKGHIILFTRFTLTHEYRNDARLLKEAYNIAVDIITDVARHYRRNIL